MALYDGPTSLFCVVDKNHFQNLKLFPTGRRKDYRWCQYKTRCCFSIDTTESVTELNITGLKSSALYCTIHTW